MTRKIYSKVAEINVIGAIYGLTFKHPGFDPSNLFG